MAVIRRPLSGAGQDLVEEGRAIIDGSSYVVLGTADVSGLPWTSPVYFAADAYRAFYWISSPEVTHARNIAVRPEVSLVVFDSRVAPGEGRLYRATVVEHSMLCPRDVEPCAEHGRAYDHRTRVVL